MTRRRRRARRPEGEFEAVIGDMAHDGRGVARIDGKATFIQGALPGERVCFRYLKVKRSHDEGVVTSVLEPVPDRVAPRCAHYALCGGCSLQHLAPEAQIRAKQEILLDNLRQLGQVEPERVYPPLVNESPWGYRRKARLGVKWVPKKGRVLVGFRERGSSKVAELSACHVLHPRVGRLLPALSELIGGLSIRDRLPQIEMAMDDARCVLIFRVLESPNEDDRARILSFGDRHDIVPYLQPGGPDTVVPLQPPGIDLHYRLPDEGLELGFLPGDFTQVNTGMNRQMVARAMELLAPERGERVLDLFCGVGNFTLPLARRAGSVVGVEGDAGLVQRARENAERNGLNNLSFHVANLYEPLEGAGWLQGRYDKALLDPPRSGAQEVLPLLPQLGVQRILYVSCYPGTLARDAGILVGRLGYRLLGAGVMDMFPHTAHVESIALFERQD
ncbi:MAG: 23S rRNA (uracil(1939)-C(5))-methyltransferase RlmD [Gammaproteobacteria bacterium]|nr:MAG: 23S rRNA (uracil(1939)-C(5))-methyltransferase RlmD [Gammaproteobacteria bacterium]